MERMALQGGGCLELREQGLMVELTACRDGVPAGLHKVWLRGDGGEFLLGTLIPDRGRLTLRRTLSRDALRQAGCWPVLGGRIGTASSAAAPGWRLELHPDTLCCHPELKECAANFGPMLRRDGGNTAQLAALFDPERPFPLSPLFCFAEIQLIDKRPHAVYTFTPEGSPVFPSK